MSSDEQRWCESGLTGATDADLRSGSIPGQKAGFCPFEGRTLVIHDFIPTDRL